MSRRQPPPAGEFPAQIIDLDQLGRGFARVNGKATFIADALPEEQVRFRYVRTTKDADEGQCTVVENASAHRVEPGCVHFGVCGGCAMQHLDPPQQIVFKQKQMLDQLRRIGKVAPDAVAEPITGPVWHYRRRARLGIKYIPRKGGPDTVPERSEVGAGGAAEARASGGEIGAASPRSRTHPSGHRVAGRMLVGFRARESGLITGLSSCKVLDARIGERLQALSETILGLSIRDAVPQVELAAANRVGLVFRVMRPPSEDDRVRLRAFGEREGFDIYLQPGGLDSIQLLDEETAEHKVLEYSPDGSELRLRFRPADFIQVNGGISQKTVNQALDWLDVQPGDRVLELFCGLGNFSLPLARRGAQVVAAEGEQGLVQRARDNAQRNGLDIRFEKADLFNTAANTDWLQLPFDKLLLDPPRAGAREILPVVAARRPRRIVYVSCHPGTLARDAGMLVQEHGYRLQRAGVMDMFPHTGHVESMALFVRDD